MNPSFGEMLMLAILALVIFGPERLPEVARNAGRMVAKFRRQANSTLDEFRRSADLRDLRELRDELRGMTADLKPRYRGYGGTRPWDSEGFGARGPLWDPEWTLETSPTEPAVWPNVDEPPLTLRSPGPPPFDPDAT